MNDKLRQQFNDQLTYLPEINQRALQSFDWATELIAIGHGYGLHIDQLEDLQIETMLVLVGLTPADDYQNEVITRLAISPSEADKIIAEVNTRIFTPIHDYIVRGGPESAPTSQSVMASAGFQMGADMPTTPISVPTPPRPAIIQNSPSRSPLQFNPSTQPVEQYEIPAEPVVHPSVQLSMDKLKKLYQDRQQIVNATIQSMDQV
jgi:hypothetical protein